MDGGVDQGPWLQERVGGGVGAMCRIFVVSRAKDALWGGLAWRGKAALELAWWTGPWGGALVGGRDTTGPRDGANFATCVVFLSFLLVQKGRNCGVGRGYPPELAWWTGG